MTSCDIPPIYDKANGTKTRTGKSDLEVSLSESKVEEKKERIMYSKEELMHLRSAPAALKRPTALQESFFNSNGLWDPIKWHGSLSSRPSSPALDKKAATKEEKRGDSLEDSVELMPQRRSFRHGCQVQQSTEPNKTEHVLAAMQNKKHLVGAANEGKRRLTGRAAGQRKVQERVHMKDKEFEPEKKNAKGSRQFGNQSGRDERRMRGQEEALPEWVTGGPTSQSDTIELKGFDDARESKKKENSHAKESTKGAGNRSAPPREENVAPKTLTLKEEAELLHAITSRGASPVVDGFDLNAFLADGGEYLPSDLFKEDTDVSMKSKFSQWFQLSQSSGNGSRPNSETGMDERQLRGSNGSPTASLPYFMPIQPAPAVSDNQPQSLMEILQKGKTSQDNKPTPVKEIKGRMNSEDVEARVIGRQKNPMQLKEQLDTAADTPPEATAFGKFVAAMKDAGQLPEKPAPVVVGLPEHLLPTPPRKSSPSFEKLKRALNNSPTPLPAPLDSSSAETQQDMMPLDPDPYQVQRTSERPVPISQPLNNARQPQVLHHGQHTPVIPSAHIDNTTLPTHSYKSQTPVSESKKSFVPAAFMPTSVIRKIHQDIHLQKSDAEKGTRGNSAVKSNGPTLHNTHSKEDLCLAPGGPCSGKAVSSNLSSIDVAKTNIGAGLTFHNAHSSSYENEEKLSEMRHLFQRLSGGHQQADNIARAVAPDEKPPNMAPSSIPFPLDMASNKGVPASANSSQPPFSNFRDEHLRQMPPRQHTTTAQGQQLLQLLHQSKEQQLGPFANPNGPLPNMHNANRFGHVNQAPSRPQLPPNFDNLFPSNNYHQQQALKQHLGINSRLPHSNAGMTPELLAQQTASQQHFLKQKLIQAAHVMQQQQQHQHQMERQLAIQRSMAASRQRFPANQGMPPYNQNLLASNMQQMLSQRMNMRGPNAVQQHRPLPTPMLSHQQMQQQQIQQQQAMLQQEALFRHPLPSVAAPPSNLPAGKDNPLSRFFDAEVLKVASARSTALPGTKALTVEELEALNK